MYSHTANMYGQPAFGGHSFQHPVNNYYGTSHQYQQQYLPPPPPVPQPPPVYHFDPSAFRKDFLTQLAGLTFNSRPIIQSLSMLAQEYSRYADIVVNCLESHIRKAPPPYKLPAFYLLDAISKNVFDPYARRFASIVTPLFLQTYSQVDDQTRNKMEEMLLTWRTGSPTKDSLFGPVTQLAIERGVWGDGKTVSITRSQVLSELQFAIGQKERAMQANPYDTDAQRKLEVLYQLHKLITEVGVSQDELRQILGQLRELVKGSTQPPPPPIPPVTSHNGWQQPAVHYPPLQSRPSSSTPQYPPQTGYPSSQYSPPPPAVASTSSAVLPIPDADNIAKILDSLKNAGVLPGALGSSQTQAPPDATSEANLGGANASCREYRASVLAHRSILSSSEILRTKPKLSEVLYDRLPSQCKQCGLRFPDNAYGKEKMDAHLDMHFTQNRKANQNLGRGYSRSWFVTAEDWIRDVRGNNKGKGRADASTVGNGPAPVQSEQELRGLFVVVPAGDEAKNVSCPICKENMKSEFLEEDEEWVWKNAVLKDEKIYHATCHAEAVSSTSSIAARLRQEVVGSSRGGTPDVLGSSRSTPPPVMKFKSPSPESSKTQGVKRKVDSDPSSEATSTPPTKKIALSSDS